MENEEYPRYILQHPDNSVEIVFAKVDPSMLTEEEKKFLKNPEVDYITVYYLTGSNNYDEEIYGKVIRHRNAANLIMELETAKNRANSKQEILDIDQQIAYLKTLANEAENLK